MIWFDLINYFCNKIKYFNFFKFLYELCNFYINWRNFLSYFFLKLNSITIFHIDNTISIISYLITIFCINFIVVEFYSEFHVSHYIHTYSISLIYKIITQRRTKFIFHFHHIIHYNIISSYYPFYFSKSIIDFNQLLKSHVEQHDSPTQLKNRDQWKSVLGH